MEVACVQRQRGLTAGGVAHKKLVGADGVAFRADAEQLALDRVDMVLRAELLGDHLIQRAQQTLTRRQPIHGEIFHAVRHPDIHHRRRAELLAKVSRYATARLAVIDPELADRLVGVRQGESVGAQRMRKAARVKIEPQLLLLRPLHPAGEVLRLDGVAIHRRLALQIDGV